MDRTVRMGAPGLVIVALCHGNPQEDSLIRENTLTSQVWGMVFLKLSVFLAALLLQIACLPAGYATAVDGGGEVPAEQNGNRPKEDDAVFKKMFLNILTTTLHKAAQAGDAEKVRALIAKGHDVNGLDKNKISPLFWAAFSKDLDVARVLVEHGADVNFTGPHGTTPLYNALHKRNEALALWLLDKGANPFSSDANGNTMLHLASLQGMAPVVEILIARGADVNALNANGQSPLTLNLFVQEKLSPLSGSPACALQLLEAGAQYEPVPWLDLSLADFFADRAVSGSAFREELQAFCLTTRNETLRAFVEKSLERAKLEDTEDTPSPGGGDSLSGSGIQGVKERDRDPKNLQSSILGTITRGEYDYWLSKPVAIPFWNNETIEIAYNFDPDEDPGFVADADKALAAFLKLDTASRLAFSKEVGEYAAFIADGWDYKGYDIKTDARPGQGFRVDSINEQWLADFIQGKKEPDAVWDMVGRVHEVILKRNAKDGLIYVCFTAECVWDAHGLLLVFKEGKELTRVSIPDGELSD